MRVFFFPVRSVLTKKKEEGSPIHIHVDLNKREKGLETKSTPPLLFFNSCFFFLSVMSASSGQIEIDVVIESLDVVDPHREGGTGYRVKVSVNGSRVLKIRQRDFPHPDAAACVLPLTKNKK